MLKKEARKIFRERRMQLTYQERNRLDDLLLIQFQTVRLPFLHAFLSYFPIEENHEPETQLINDYLRFGNPEVKVCYPIANFANNTLKAAMTDLDTPFLRKELNILEPESEVWVDAGELDLVLVPLLAVDQSGYRVGYGKGFYDQYLATCRPDCIKVGISYFEPIDRLEDRHEFDVPLDLCITPQNAYVF